MKKKLLIILLLTNAGFAQPNPFVTEAQEYVIFTPDKNPIPHIVKLIDNAKSSVDVAIFGFTDLDIANALISANKRGCMVRVYRDNTQSGSKAQKAINDLLKKEGIQVKIKEQHALMHMKMIIVDRNKYATGSFNWSLSAKSQDNDYRFCLNDCIFIMDYNKKFEAMWRR